MIQFHFLGALFQRRIDLHPHEHVAETAIFPFQSFVFQPQFLTVVDPGRNFQLNQAGRCRDRYLVPHDRLFRINRQIGLHIDLVFNAPNRVWQGIQPQQQVARSAAAIAGAAEALQP